MIYGLAIHSMNGTYIFEYHYWYAYLKQSKRDLHENLIAELCHPRRIEKWLLDGKDLDDYLP